MEIHPEATKRIINDYRIFLYDVSLIKVIPLVFKALLAFRAGFTQNVQEAGNKTRTKEAMSCQHWLPQTIYLQIEFSWVYFLDVY